MKVIVVDESCTNVLKAIKKTNQLSTFTQVLHNLLTRAGGFLFCLSLGFTLIDLLIDNLRDKISKYLTIPIPFSISNQSNLISLLSHQH